ncbi:hypothetical protein VRK_34000 [Vibrio sp. MEBiC08052]|nr:hypothetical protein VRK_34000 [Vibrio sp. MEBiC08052]
MQKRFNFSKVSMIVNIVGGLYLLYLSGASALDFSHELSVSV